MNHADMKDSIVSAWQVQKSLTPESALSIANELMKGNPREQQEFSKWFEKNGTSALQRINRNG